MDNQYGKLIGAGAGNALGAAIVELGNEYLPHPLPASAVIVVMAGSSMLLTYLAKHCWLTFGKGDTPSAAP